MLLTLVILNVFYTKIEEERAFSIGISLVIMSLIIYENNVVFNKQKLIQHNPKTGELEPVGKLKEIMEEIK